MAVLELTKENFEATITDNAMVIVDFWAPWCGPCKSFAPVFETMSERHADMVFAKVNTEEEQELAGTFGIRSIPTLMFFREQVMLFNQAGALPESSLTQVIEQGKALDMDEVRNEIAAAQKAEEDSAKA